MDALGCGFLCFRNRLNEVIDGECQLGGRKPQSLVSCLEGDYWVYLMESKFDGVLELDCELSRYVFQFNDSISLPTLVL